MLLTNQHDSTDDYEPLQFLLNRITGLRKSARTPLNSPPDFTCTFLFWAKTLENVTLLKMTRFEFNKDASYHIFLLRVQYK